MMSQNSLPRLTLLVLSGITSGNERNDQPVSTSGSLCNTYAKLQTEKTNADLHILDFERTDGRTTRAARRSVTSVHQVEAMAPRYFVQVIFYKLEPDSMFIGGEPVFGSHLGTSRHPVGKIQRAEGEDSWTDHV
jgi:hypothetical protein